MSKQTDGGPAFPWEQSPGNQDNLGLTKRDWFAGMALIGNLASETEEFRFGDDKSTGITRAQVMATDCYGIADAMLEAREK
jgi:hypothetical protein